jgi:hypothetical protein
VIEVAAKLNDRVAHDYEKVVTIPAAWQRVHSIQILKRTD